METRIKVEQDSNGRKRYTPQRKAWLGWRYFSAFNGYCSSTVTFEELKEAQKFIKDREAAERYRRTDGEPSYIYPTR